jgi:hypothetical protein
VAAVALGDSTALLLSLLGLGALLAASAFWFTVVKTLGGLYLLFLAVKLLRAGVAARLDTPQAGAASRWRLFANTYLVTALNPKGIIFFVAFLPQFIQPARALLPQYLVLGLTFASPWPPPRHTGPTAWITKRAGSAKPGVILASPVGQPPSARQARSRPGPAARWMAPSTPPPPSKLLLAALTMASTDRVVMSASSTSRLTRALRCGAGNPWPPPAPAACAH